MLWTQIWRSAKPASDRMERLAQIRIRSKSLAPRLICGRAVVEKNFEWHQAIGHDSARPLRMAARARVLVHSTIAGLPAPAQRDFPRRVRACALRGHYVRSVS